MKKVAFECEVTTPMFISGADQNVAELRVPSIKGVLRFWWRAMGGYSDMEALHREEANIFGGSSDKQGRSKVILRLEDVKIKESSKYHGKEGLDYLLYSVKLNKRQAIGEFSTFSLVFSSTDENKLNEAIKAFGMLVNFGGLGTRTRRGAGSFVVTEIKKPQDFIIKDEYLFNLSANITEVSQLIDHFEKINQTLPEVFSYEYSCLKNFRYCIFKPKAEWKIALNDLGELYKGFRDKEKGRKIEKLNFGFSNDNLDEISCIIQNEQNQQIDRRSSPLIFKILKTSKNCFFPVVVWLQGELIPDEFSIMQNTRKLKTPDTEIVCDFRKYMKKNGAICKLSEKE